MCVNMGQWQRHVFKFVGEMFGFGCFVFEIRSLVAETKTRHPPRRRRAHGPAQPHLAFSSFWQIIFKAKIVGT